VVPFPLSIFLCFLSLGRWACAPAAVFTLLGGSFDASHVPAFASLLRGRWEGEEVARRSSRGMSRYHGQEERREESHPFYLRAGGACFLYIHCQALPVPSHFFFWRCAAGRLPSSPGLLPSGLGGAVPVRCCFGILPSGNVPSRANMHLHDTYPMHLYRLRVTIALNFGRCPRCPQRKPEKTCKIAKLITKR